MKPKPFLIYVIVTISLTLAGCSAPSDSSPYDGKTALFILGEREYGTPESLPKFAKEHLDSLGIESKFAVAQSDDRESPLCHTFTDLEAIDSADILIISTRRRFPTTTQLDSIRQWIESGKPIIAVRTASHAFGARAKGTGYQPPRGHASWNTFDVDVLGAKYEGHYPSKEGQPVLSVDGWIEESAKEHAIVKGLSFEGPITVGDKLYEYVDLQPDVNVLLSARWKEGEPDQPIAWTLEQSSKRVFYMSPGGVEEMATSEIQSLLLSAIKWGLDG